MAKAPAAAARRPAKGEHVCHFRVFNASRYEMRAVIQRELVCSPFSNLLEFPVCRSAVAERGVRARRVEAGTNAPVGGTGG